MPKLRFINPPIEIEVKEGSEFLEIYRSHPQIPLKFGCTYGDCGVCAIKIREGEKNLTKRTKQEEATLKRKRLSDQYRLACQCALNGPVTID